MAGTKPNSTSFKPGKSGNPKGRPKKGETMTDIIKGVLEEEFRDNKGNKITFKIAMARKAAFLAVQGDMTAFKYLCDRLDGYPIQAAKVEGELNITVGMPEPPEDAADE